jgi:IS5 family transposase
MKAHIGVDVDSGLVHTVTTTAANEADIEQVEELLHGKEEVVHADAATAERTSVSNAKG